MGSLKKTLTALRGYKKGPKIELREADLKYSETAHKEKKSADWEKLKTTIA